MTYCSCWQNYPNKNHRKDNGRWKCVDCYENIKNTDGKRKTKCVKKESMNDSISGNDSSESQDKEE